MKKELEQTLYQLYPNLYRSTDDRFYGIDTGSGWYSLIKDLSEELERLIMKLPESERKRFHAIQVKEKFGTLAFYLSNSSNEMDEIIQKATQASAHICDVCGESGKVCTRFWLVQTRCSEHVNDTKI